MKQFQLQVQYISYGWCDIEMRINDKQLFYLASYVGPNPLSSLIEACMSFKNERKKCFIKWQAEPGIFQLEMFLHKDNQLRLDIYEKNGEKVCKEWHEIIPYSDFLEAVVSEGFRVLNSFGIRGFRTAWQNDEEFPLGALLEISGKADDEFHIDACCSNLPDEIECMTNYMKILEPQKETHYNQCSIYYESWQMQCCGAPFDVGEQVDWTCHVASEIKNAHGFVIDFEEDHHDFSTHSITGTISKIIAEYSECPKGKKMVYYHQTPVIHSEVQRADGYENNYKSDESTNRRFLGYIVILKDVVVKALYTNAVEQQK